MAAPRTITIHDGGQPAEPVEDLRGLTKLWKRLKEAAGIVTALGVLFTGITGSARLAIKWAGLATSAEVAAAAATVEEHRQADAKVDGERWLAWGKKLDAISKTADTTAAAVARLEKHRPSTSRKPPTGSDGQ